MCIRDSRTIDLGMLDLIRSISERQGVDEHIALTHMLSNYEGAMTDPASMDLYHRMAAEITKAVNFYNYNNRQQALRRVYLCGEMCIRDSYYRNTFENFRHKCQKLRSFPRITGISMEKV